MSYPVYTKVKWQNQLAKPSTDNRIRQQTTTKKGKITPEEKLNLPVRFGQPPHLPDRACLVYSSPGVCPHFTTTTAGDATQGRLEARDMHHCWRGPHTDT